MNNVALVADLVPPQVEKLVGEKVMTALVKTALPYRGCYIADGIFVNTVAKLLRVCVPGEVQPDGIAYYSEIRVSWASMHEIE